ncbi:SgcJ/EcaC family oxidoreductase [Plantactinospora sp. GCM10030261]|uniref:SgcJ/EcaC family oxidoreductase n=1 Tax=Plantactinospora sp. GCM10030261 TaxID=3273420 RepID=UPI0036210A8D
MRVLVLGGTGYIGSTVVDHLENAGHEPVLFLREGSTDAPPGREIRRGDLTRPETLTAALTDDIDAVVHAAAPVGDWDADLAAIDALLTPMRGTSRSLVYLSGVWVLGETHDEADEASPTRAIEIVSGRPLVEDRVRAAARAGVGGVVVRPGIVHGKGAGIPGMLVAWARQHGVGRHVGGGNVRWPAVHVRDLADLVVLALERAEPGTVLHGVAEAAVPVADLARAADLVAGGVGREKSWPEQLAAEEIGATFAEALALHQVVGAPAALALGWKPHRAGAVEDLRSGSYVAHPDSFIRVRPPQAAQRQRADVEAITALVGDVERAQQNESPDDFIAQFAPEAVWTTAHGKRLVGRGEIDAFTRRVLPGAMRDSTATYTVEQILFVRADVAVVTIRQRPISLAGEPLTDQPEGRPTYVLAHDDGRWQITAGQNTQVKEG